MPRHLLQESVDRLAAMAEPPASVAGGAVAVHTLLIPAALCFLLCVVGLAVVARCSRFCNPSAFSVDEPGTMAAKAPCKGIKKKALQSLPTVSWAALLGQSEEECAICLAEFARGDEVHVLPPCGHGFHAACVDIWLLSSSTSCASTGRGLRRGDVGGGTRARCGRLGCCRRRRHDEGALHTRCSTGCTESGF